MNAFFKYSLIVLFAVAMSQSNITHIFNPCLFPEHTIKALNQTDPENSQKYQDWMDGTSPMCRGIFAYSWKFVYDASNSLAYHLPYPSVIMAMILYFGCPVLLFVVLLWDFFNFLDWCSDVCGKKKTSTAKTGPKGDKIV